MLTTAPGGEEVGDTIVGITTTDAQDCSTDFAGISHIFYSRSLFICGP